MAFAHLTVMPDEAASCLGIKKGGIYVDATVGGGGHAKRMFEGCEDIRVVGMDRDDDALRAAGETLRPYGERVTLVKGNFADMKPALERLGIGKVDGILMDLGVSSYQFDTPGRGFSFRFDARLDMRMDTAQEKTAYTLVNELGAEELAHIFRTYGEERFSGRVAAAIVEARKRKPVETTGELREIVYNAIPRRFHPRDIHPATRVFQALRIAVNDELESLERGLKDGFEALKSGGRMAVISFHSLEDRLVKDAFRDFSTGCVCPPRIPMCVCGRSPKARLLFKKAVTPSPEEMEKNPRARSAKLRAVERL